MCVGDDDDAGVGVGAHYSAPHYRAGGVQVSGQEEQQKMHAAAVWVWPAGCGDGISCGEFQLESNNPNANGNEYRDLEMTIYLVVI